MLAGTCGVIGFRSCWGLLGASATRVADVPVRLGHRMRGLPPGRARTLEQRLAELKGPPPLRTDIGLPPTGLIRSKDVLERSKQVRERRQNPELEKLARNNSLLVDLDVVERDWLHRNGQQHIRTILDHYNVFKDLYDEGYFLPRVPIYVGYDVDEENVCPVYYGNIIKPSQADKAPVVMYNAPEDTYWTLILTGLDDNILEPGKECLHWCITNIPGNDLSKGETYVDYMQPIPPKGTGYHRYVFVLYKQDKKQPFDIAKVSGNTNLDNRTFNSRDWYEKYQDAVTPAGIAFFQSDWEHHLTDFFHKKLNMEEPVYEYKFDEPYIKPQEWFPKKQPFNTYMDKHRDRKETNKYYFLREMKEEHPFKKPKPPLKFPNAHPYPADMPSWLKLHEKKIRLKWGDVNEVQ